MDNLDARLNTHLQELDSDPSLKLDERLFEQCALILRQTISKEESVPLIVKLSEVVPKLHSDPTPAIHLLIVLLQPYSFSDVLSIGNGIDFVAGLDTRAVPYNRLLLALLRKATDSATDAATVASQPEIIAALVKLWLCTPDAGIASESGDIILGLLKVDNEPSLESSTNGLIGQGQGLVWKRLFQDQDVYSLFYHICSLSSKETSLDLTKSQRTLAQARLLEWLPKAGALQWHTIASKHHPNVESKYVAGQEGSLLRFASTNMVDVKDDVLMHRCLIDFFAELLSTVTEKNGASSLQSSLSLDFLLDSNLHSKALAYYLDPTNPKHDPLDLHFLYGPSANYVSVYASTYPDHFLSSPAKAATLKRLSQTLDLSPSRWAHAESPKNDLHVLSSLPRSALLPQGAGSQTWPSSPVSLLPSKSSNPDVLNTLATLFHGPIRNDTIVFPQSSPMTDHTDPQAQSEAQAARALYFLYVNYNPRLFADLVAHAETIALKDHALAAINVIAAIATSNWSSFSDSEQAGGVTSEDDLLSWLPSVPTATPASGVLAILTPPSLEHTLPYLLKSAQSFSNLVGGRGDSESAAYKIATAKFDALRALHDRLQTYVDTEPGQGYEEIVETLRKRIAQGPWSREGEVGGRIATMDL